MKILYHHRTASDDGQAVHIASMVNALRDNGHEVMVVGPHRGERGSEQVIGWVDWLKRLLPKALYELLELGYSVVAYRRLRRAAEEFRPDVLYERYNLYLVAGAWLRRRLGVPLLLEVNAPLAEERAAVNGLGIERLARWSEVKAWRAADTVLPVTGVLAAKVREAGVSPSRIKVIPNGIDLSLVRNAPAADAAKAALGLGDALVLGFTGYVRPWHGVDKIVRWMAAADAPANAVLLVVGDGPARPGIEALAAGLGLADRVRFTGFVAHDRVPAHVVAFDVALNPAVVAYASPLKLFEYLAFGKAIVAPRQPNLEEVLRDGHNALLFDVDDAGSLARALTRLASDAGLRERLGRAAAASIGEQGLTWSAHARTVAQLAAQLCDRLPGGNPLNATATR